MNTLAAIRLAVDILNDHFGSVVGRVGGVLLERGALSIADILRFSNNNGDVADQPLTFPQVRNALLALVQHGIVDSKPHPQVASNDFAKGLLQIYRIDIEEVLCRLRFPHFLEHVQHNLGDLAYRLLFSVLRYGRVCGSMASEEAKKALGPGSGSADRASDELKRLVQMRYLRIVEPSGGKGPLAAAASQPAASQPAPLQDGEADSSTGQGQKRKRDEEGLDAERPPEQQVVPAQAPESSHMDCVYRLDRNTLNLCVCKNMFCRVMIERVSTYAAQVLAVLLTAVRYKSTAEGAEEDPAKDAKMEVECQFMQFFEVEAKMKEMGYHQSGRDPGRSNAQLKRTLDLLSAHEGGVVRKRTSTRIGEGWELKIPKGDGPKSGKWVPCTLTGEGTKPNTKNVRVAELDFEGEYANVPLDALRKSKPQSNQLVEWGVEWISARKLLKQCATSQLVRDQFGNVGLRIYNLLIEKEPPQKLEEKEIFSTCMVPPAEGREVLNEMVRRFVICWQEVPKSANTPLAASFWLYYVDKPRFEMAMIQNVLQAVLNLRIRFRTESAKVVPLAARQDSLTAKERADLKAGRRIEDTLERSFLVLDAAVLIFRCF